MSVDEGIQSVRPKIIKRKTKVKVIKETNYGSEEACLKTGESRDQKHFSETVDSGNQRRVYTVTVDEEQSVECCKKVGKLESQEGLSLSLQVLKENRETIYRDILKSRKSMRCGAFGEMERFEKRVVMRKGYTLA